jgi:hypothetical protein
VQINATKSLISQLQYLQYSLCSIYFRKSQLIQLKYSLAREHNDGQKKFQAQVQGYSVRFCVIHLHPVSKQSPCECLINQQILLSVFLYLDYPLYPGPHDRQPLHSVEAVL